MLTLNSRCCRVNPDAGLSPTVDTRSWDGNIEVKRSRLLYRARQTGWLDTDLLCGAFASGAPSMPTFLSKLFYSLMLSAANVKSLTDSELDMFVKLMCVPAPRPPRCFSLTHLVNSC